MTNHPEFFRNDEILKSLSRKQTDIKFVHVTDEIFGKLKVPQGHITTAAYYRLSIPSVLPKELKKVIYLDSDLIVNTDIGKLWDMDIGQNHILAVQEQGKNALYVSSPDGLLTYKELGIDPRAKHFNTGVMLINVGKWREDDIPNRVVQFIQRNEDKIRWWDQDGLNALLADKWGEINHRWNLLSQIFWNQSWKDGPVGDRTKYKELIRNPYFVHFNTDQKPWQKKSVHPYKYLFDYYYNISMPEFHDASLKSWDKKSVHLNKYRFYYQIHIVVPMVRWIHFGIKIMSRAARRLKIKNILVYYYKNIYRKQIRFSKPVLCDNDSEFEVHILTSEADYLDAMWCLKAFYNYSELNPKLVIHEDGTLSEAGMKMFSNHFVNCRIIRRKDADTDMRSYLRDHKFSQKNRLNENFVCSLKLFDTFYYAEKDKILYLDSDILFFQKPSEMIDLIKSGIPFFNSDYQNAYIKSIDELNDIFDIDILPKVNAGLMFLEKRHFIDNLDFIESYFEIMEDHNAVYDVNRHEQSLNAMLLSKSGALRLDRHYQISKEPVTDRTKSHHFVNDGSRSNFYKEGLKYLKLRNFLG